MSGPLVGIGLRHPHAAALLEAPPPLAFVEVHSENYYAEGGAAAGVLHAARERWPVSLHGVALAPGSAAGIDQHHLQQLAALVRRIDPVRVSDHACFARAPRQDGGPVVHGSDLLPLAHTAASLDILVSQVQQVQDTLRRPLLLENLSAYLRWADDDIPEPLFFNELARRSGCGLLLDVNNLVVNALNDGLDDDAAAAAACRWVDTIDPAIVGEIHLAGYDAGGTLVIDDHGSRVHPPVWRVYRHAVQRLGPRPTLIEWDTALPELQVLLDEAAMAEAIVATPRAAVAAPP